MNVKEIAVTVTSIAAVIALGYGVVTKAGYVISRSEAQGIAQQTVLAESIARERGQLELQRDLKFTRLSLLANRATRTVDEESEIASLRADIQRINARLAEINK